jgi:hypothetical protein
MRTLTYNSDLLRCLFKLNSFHFSNLISNNGCRKLKKNRSALFNGRLVIKRKWREASLDSTRAHNAPKFRSLSLFRFLCCFRREGRRRRRRRAQHPIFLVSFNCKLQFSSNILKRSRKKRASERKRNEISSHSTLTHTSE